MTEPRPNRSNANRITGVNRKKAFVDRPRKSRETRPVAERVKDYREVYREPSEGDIIGQASRCMDCGIPFCHASGCPLANIIPELNDQVGEGRWKEACDLLHTTSNFPEFTGRLCPALCEAACTLGVGFEPVTIRDVELEVVERGWRDGYIVPRPPEKRTGRKVAVVGSGPAGLVAAQILNWAGHRVTVFESDDRVGGFLRYGVPDFKLEKWVIDRRVDLLVQEGIIFETGVNVGEDVSAHYLLEKFDAVCLCAGSREPRDLPIPGRELKGVYLALEYLGQSNRRQMGDAVSPEELIDAKGKVVVILGGGDTGADCVGTANRQGARKVWQFELLPEPPRTRTDEMPWPSYPAILRSSTSHEEGCEQRWSIQTKEFLGANGALTGLRACELDWTKDEGGAWRMQERPGSEFTQEADLVLLALGFVRPDHDRLLTDLGVEFDARGNVRIDAGYMSSVDRVFAAGDVTMGASLIVRAMNAGRQMAEAVKRYLRD